MEDGKAGKKGTKKKNAPRSRKKTLPERDQPKRAKRTKAPARKKLADLSRPIEFEETQDIEKPRKTKGTVIDKSKSKTQETSTEIRKMLGPSLKKRLLKLISNVLIIGGIVAMLIPVCINGYSYYSQRRLRRMWESKIEELTGKLKLPANKKLEFRLPDNPEEDLAKQNGIAYLVIPRMALKAVVVEGANFRDLIKGPGHLKGTALPGEKGNCVISGHRTMYGAPFGDLDKMTPGADILIYTNDHIFHYVVSDKKIVSPGDLSVIDKTEESRLTLTTCNPKFSDRQRLIIVARLEETVQ